MKKITLVSEWKNHSDPDEFVYSYKDDIPEEQYDCYELGINYFVNLHLSKAIEDSMKRGKQMKEFNIRIIPKII